MNRLPARRLPRGRRAQDGGRSGVDDRAVGRSRVRLRAGWTATGAEARGDALQRRVERQLGAALAQHARAGRGEPGGDGLALVAHREFAAGRSSTSTRAPA